MLGHRELGLDEYVAILRRRKWFLLVPALLGPIVALGVARVLPEQYTSTTLVLVERQKVPESFVKSVITDELNQRLGTMREQIMSRTRLQPIIEKFGLYKNEAGKVPMEDLVNRLREAIVVTPVRPVMKATRGNQQEVPGFFITVTANEARTAQQVCAEVTSMFMEENLKSREQRAQGTTDFLQKQLDEAKRKLDEEDKRLAAFKQRYAGQLPEQAQTNMNLLSSASTQLEAVTQALNRAQQDKAYMESLLGQQLTAWEASRSGTSPETLEQQLAKMESALVTLEARYTPDHPDVIKMKNDIAQVQKKLEEATSTRAGKTPDQEEKSLLTEPPQILQLRGQIHQTEVMMKEKTRAQARLQEQIKLYQARVQLSPVVEQQYKELTRDFDTAQSFYNDLLSKKTQSEIATDLERRQQGEQFRLMDPANLPAEPSFPNRLLFAGVGLGAGIFLGAVLALGLEMRDKSLRSERDVEFFLALPTLGTIPTVETGAPSKRGFWKRRKAEAAA